jgi:hypothetical protein
MHKFPTVKDRTCPISYQPLVHALIPELAFQVIFLPTLTCSGLIGKEAGAWAKGVKKRLVSDSIVIVSIPLFMSVSIYSAPQKRSNTDNLDLSHRQGEVFFRFFFSLSKSRDTTGWTVESRDP